MFIKVLLPGGAQKITVFNGKKLWAHKLDTYLQLNRIA